MTEKAFCANNNCLKVTWKKQPKNERKNEAEEYIFWSRIDGRIEIDRVTPRAQQATSNMQANKCCNAMLWAKRNNRNHVTERDVLWFSSRLMQNRKCFDEQKFNKPDNQPKRKKKKIKQIETCVDLNKLIKCTYLVVSIYRTKEQMKLNF